MAGLGLDQTNSHCLETGFTVVEMREILLCAQEVLEQIVQQISKTWLSSAVKSFYY